MKTTLHVAIAAALLFHMAAASADRQPVLSQIAVPHSYYFREMYLPQATTGPTSPAWSPDGSTLVYSMQGSLWKQALGSDTAVQLTAGPFYDYQPDWSPDGKRIVFTRYKNHAMELQVLEVDTGKVTQLTRDRAVNLEPRWSPDGSRLAFVSTSGTGRFHIFVGSIEDGTLNASPLFDERESEVERYYYSSYDHELHPSWSPDGREILYVGNPEVPYGTGGIWRVTLDSAEAPVLVRNEETSWRARPDWSPEGKRIIYASYLGRQWHQLWTTAVSGGGEPFPLTYGEFDIASPRYSPDGQKIAYVANESGNTELRIQDAIGGKVEIVEPVERVYLRPMGGLLVSIEDGRGAAAPARLSVVAADGREYAPDSGWLHADDGYDRSVADFETHYFHSDGEAALTLPAGPARVTVWRGLENEIETRLVTVSANQQSSLTIRAEPLALPGEWDAWQSADVHVHMNYGGAYRNTPQKMVQQAQAEDLDLVFNLIVNKEQRIPDIDYFSTAPDEASNDDVTLLHAQEYHTSYWGHMGLLGLGEHYLLPDYSSYPGTAAASLYPDNIIAAGMARSQGAIVGYVHPFDAPAPNPATAERLTNSLPVNAAHGLLDYYEVVGFADHRTSAEVWYRLLNCGFRIAAAGGTDAMANYASLRGPVGMNRTYVEMPREDLEPAARQDAWLSGLKDGRSLATNGPLLGLTVNGEGPGSVLLLDANERELTYSGFLRSMVPVDHLELVYNGKVVETFDLRGERRSADLSGSVQVDESGWLLVRAWNEGSHPSVFDLYPYATTTPVYVNVDGKAPQSAEDADYFIAWIERIRESAAEHPDYNSDEERAAVLAHLDRAVQVFEQRRGD
ncbi:MAG TPA: CehA/McbA family metallohydrolase [Woeseiaceae bacterium]|nr:CehA/McbA family metallohydrolase [Woeseiaceae bacterium]